MSFDPGDTLFVNLKVQVDRFDSVLERYIVRDVVSGDSFLLAENRGTTQFRKEDPPVIAFQPGDTVRNRETGALLSIGRRGYYSHTTQEFVTTTARFTSTSFEKVNLDESGGKRALREGLQREFR